MNPQPFKLPTPAAGAPPSGLLQFGEQQPGLYISAEDAFALRLILGDCATLQNAIPASFDPDEDDFEIVLQELEGAAHVQQMLQRPAADHHPV